MVLYCLSHKWAWVVPSSSAPWQVDVLVWNCSFCGAQLMFVLTLSEKQVSEGQETGVS